MSPNAPRVMRSSTTSRRLGGEFRDNPQFCEVASGASDKQNKGEARGAFCGKSERSERFPQNVRDIRSFSGRKWKKNLGEGRAEPRTVYPLLSDPNGTKWSESAAWLELRICPSLLKIGQKIIFQLSKIIYDCLILYLCC
jgi:hypothetical protein